MITKYLQILYVVWSKSNYGTKMCLERIWFFGWITLNTLQNMVNNHNDSMKDHHIAGILKEKYIQQKRYYSFPDVWMVSINIVSLFHKCYIIILGEICNTSLWLLNKIPYFKLHSQNYQSCINAFQDMKIENRKFIHFSKYFCPEKQNTHNSSTIHM